MDFPAQSRSKLVSECLFPVLALVPHSTLPASRRQSDVISVHLVDGRCYQFEVDAGEMTLQWLLKRTLERKEAEEQAAGSCGERLLKGKSCDSSAA